MNFLPVTTLDRYLFRQMVGYFGIAICVFTLIAFFSDTFLDFIKDVQKYGIPIGTAAKMMVYQMPTIIALMLIPSAFLSVLLVFSSLNAQFEVIAMRMNGISLRRLVYPALLLGLLSAGLMYVLYDYVAPYCKNLINYEKQKALSVATLPIGKESFTYKDFDENNHLRQMIYVSRYDGDLLKDATIIDLSKTNVMQIIHAKTGQWHRNYWAFNNANAYTIHKHSELLDFAHFGKMKIKNMLQESKNKKEEVNPDFLSFHASENTFQSLLNNVRVYESRNIKVPDITYIKLWEKITLPLCCFAIVLTALPLALTPPRRGGRRGFIFALGVLMLYYLLRPISVSLGTGGLLTFGGLIPFKTSLVLAAWLPFVAIILLGVVMLVRKSKVL